MRDLRILGCSEVVFREFLVVSNQGHENEKPKAALILAVLQSFEELGFLSISMLRTSGLSLLQKREYRLLRLIGL